MATTLIKKADALAAYLNLNCLTEDSLNGLDILDSLASLGFELADDTEGHSSAAYFTVIHDAVVGPSDPPKRALRLFRRHRALPLITQRTTTGPPTEKTPAIV